jgi:DNA-binding MarR family transcriptional regulator
MVTYGTITPLLDDELRSDTDLDLQTYDALLHVHESGEPGIRMTDLARKVVLSKSGLTTLVDRLEERSLLRRIPDSDDRRAIRITLTERGRESFRRAANIHMAGIEKYFTDRLTEDEAEVVADVLERILRDVGSTGP